MDGTENDFEVDQRLFSDLLQSIEEYVVVLDREGRIRYVNFTGDGYKIENVIGTDAALFVHPDYRPAHRERFRRVLEDEQPQSFEVPGPGETGEREWYRGTVTPLVREGRTVGLVVLMKNVTDLRRAQKEATDLKRLLPICPWCSQKVRVGPDQWIPLQEYFYSRDSIFVTHGMCPDCGEDMVGER